MLVHLLLLLIRVLHLLLLLLLISVLKLLLLLLLIRVLKLLLLSVCRHHVWTSWRVTRRGPIHVPVYLMQRRLRRRRYHVRQIHRPLPLRKSRRGTLPAAATLFRQTAVERSLFRGTRSVGGSCRSGGASFVRVVLFENVFFVFGSDFAAPKAALAEVVVCAFRLVAKSSKVLSTARATGHVMSRVFGVGDSVKDQQPGQTLRTCVTIIIFRTYVSPPYYLSISNKLEFLLNSKELLFQSIKSINLEIKRLVCDIDIWSNCVSLFNRLPLPKL